MTNPNYTPGPEDSTALGVDTVPDAIDTDWRLEDQKHQIVGLHADGVLTEQQAKELFDRAEQDQNDAIRRAERARSDGSSLWSRTIGRIIPKS